MNEIKALDYRDMMKTQIIRYFSKNKGFAETLYNNLGMSSDITKIIDPEGKKLGDVILDFARRTAPCSLGELIAYLLEYGKDFEYTHKEGQNSKIISIIRTLMVKDLFDITECDLSDLLHESLYPETM